MDQAQHQVVGAGGASTLVLCQHQAVVVFAFASVMMEEAVAALPMFVMGAALATTVVELAAEAALQVSKVVC